MAGANLEILSISLDRQNEIAGDIQESQLMLSEVTERIVQAEDVLRRLVVNAYRDDAVGVLEKNADGKLAVTRVVLRPAVEFEGTQPSAADLEKLHHIAHEQCFIANSVKTEVTVEPQG